MLSGKLPPPTVTVPEATPREDAPATAGKRTVDSGTDVLSLRSSLVSHGAARRAIAPHGSHAHHAHQGHRGASQTERVIATVARNIVVSGGDGSSIVTQEVDQVAFLVTCAAPPAAEGLDDDDDDIDTDAADDTTAESDTPLPDDVSSGGDTLADPLSAERSVTRGTDSEQDPFALDGVQGARGRDGLRAESADANGSGGGWGGGGSSSAGGVQAADGVEPASAATSIRTAGADKAAIARIERAAPARRTVRPKTPHEHKAARIAGIGLAAAAVVLVLALLVAIFAHPTPGARGDENEETRQER